MRLIDLAGMGAANVFRSKTRSILTILAIFVGAFTLSLTNGIGTGVNNYIKDTVAAIGVGDVLTVTKAGDSASGIASITGEPAEYDPEVVAVMGPPGTTVKALTDEDISGLADTPGVLRVEPARTIKPDFIEGESGVKYVVSLGSLIPGQRVELAAGELPAETSSYEAVLPASYVEPLGFADDEGAIGQMVTLQITDAGYEAHSLEVRITGVSEPGLVSPGAAGLIPSEALSDALYNAQQTGVPDDEADLYTQASVWFASEASPEEVTALQERLGDAGYEATSVEDQLGTFTSVIDGIVLVLNAFGVIALLAAGLGIVNTLFMSVQERTREIGIMKAVGMSDGQVFGLFSLEAGVIGLLGAALGVGGAILVGGVVSAALSTSVLSELTGLTLISFTASGITVIILAVLGLALLAGTLPAARAARANPVQSLRYE